jgi:hypothetical protein
MSGIPSRSTKSSVERTRATSKYSSSAIDDTSMKMYIAGADETRSIDRSAHTPLEVYGFAGAPPVGVDNITTRADSGREVMSMTIGAGGEIIASNSSAPEASKKQNSLESQVDILRSSSLGQQVHGIMTKGGVVPSPSPSQMAPLSHGKTRGRSAGSHPEDDNSGSDSKSAATYSALVTAVILFLVGLAAGMYAAKKNAKTFRYRNFRPSPTF